jgi:DNA adenine methylase
MIWEDSKSMRLQAPFPYFGGKSTIAETVWQALGQPARYIEPCFGSGAVLLSRPDYEPSKHYETVNDKDGFIANVWRGLRFAPDDVAEWCDWPVNHADLMARRMELIKNEDRLLENLVADSEWFDPKLAGYWIWAASCWIGSGLTRKNAIPNSSKPNGVHKRSIVNGKRPHLIVKKGVHKRSLVSGQIPHLGSKRGVGKSVNIYEWFNLLSERLRNVQVVCGDWNRVCGGNWQDGNGTVGIFFDPPYSATDRDVGVYHHDCTTIAQDIGAWSLIRGAKESYRIIIAGYDGEHPQLEAAGWTKQGWKAQGGYGNQGDGQGKANRHREMLWFSPHCLTTESKQTSFI